MLPERLTSNRLEVGNGKSGIDDDSNNMKYTKKPEKLSRS